MPSAPQDQRRRFARIFFNATATVRLNGRQIAAEVSDLSLKGALLRVAANELLAGGTRCTFELRLDEGDAHIQMACMVAHCEPDGEATRIGLRCLDIDLDSATHLRRLVELNLGDDTLLQREFSALTTETASC